MDHLLKVSTHCSLGGSYLRLVVLYSNVGLVTLNGCCRKCLDQVIVAPGDSDHAYQYILALVYSPRWQNVAVGAVDVTYRHSDSVQSLDVT